MMCVCVCVCMYSVVSDSLQSQDFQSPLSMEFSRQEYWSWLLCPIPWDLPDLGIEPMSPAHVSCIAGRFFTTEPLGEMSLYNVV